MNVYISLLNDELRKREMELKACEECARDDEECVLIFFGLFCYSFRMNRYDVSSAEETVVPARGKACVSTGLKISIPSGTYARIAPRSGLAVKYVLCIQQTQLKS